MDKQYMFRRTIMGYPIYTGDLDLLPVLKKVLINTINQYSYCMAEKDADFKKSLLESDILLPDGIGIVAASMFLEGKKITKVAGADLHQHLLKQLNDIGGRCFYLGSTEYTLNIIKQRLAKDFPAVLVATYSPPYRTFFSNEESNLMLSAVNAFKPDVLFIGMTAPKQEKWAHTYKELLDAKIICSIGAVFDFYAGVIERPSNTWINLGLEWLGRLIKEPKRMWKRYLYYGPIFVGLLLFKKVKQYFPYFITK